MVHGTVRTSRECRRRSALWMRLSAACSSIWLHESRPPEIWWIPGRQFHVQCVLFWRWVRAPILLPAIFRVISALRPVLSVGNGVQAVARNAQVDHKGLGRRGSAIAQTEIVFFTAPFVAMSFDGDFGIGIGL